VEINQLVELLRQNELLFAELYRECARLFPDYKIEFEEFVSEENAHAAVFAKIAEDIRLHPDNWRMGKVSIKTVEIVQNQINEALAEIRSGRVAPRYAITALRNFEQGMGERAAEKLIETSSEYLKNEVAGIRSGFTGHLQRLQQLERKIFPRSGTEALFEI
jgi:hypothetical protein